MCLSKCPQRQMAQVGVMGREKCTDYDQGRQFGVRGNGGQRYNTICGGWYNSISGGHTTMSAAGVLMTFKCDDTW